MNKFQKDDQLVVRTGSHKGYEGKIIKVFPKENAVIIEGLTKKKHIKPTQNSQGGIKDINKQIDWSNIMLVSSTGKKKLQSKIGFSSQGKQKNRILKKTGQNI